MSTKPDASPLGKAQNDLYFRPEDEKAFRLAQLIMLLEITSSSKINPNIDRLGALDFFSANPFLVIGETDSEFRHLVLAGFSVKPLTYASPGHRFITRRSRLQNDLAMLVAYGLAKASTSKGHRVYIITDSGREISEQLTSVYADAYRASAEVVSKRIEKVPDTKLQEKCRDWLKADPAMMDLYDL
ncbi:ABC-three component system middle component 2 [Streptomyces sp. XY431]|uniref:ABC-three component system middle component 2 n=1 Tax=Streptomyces sp. XY431 TaxID=1415562 RepID=UPI000B02B71A|nr:ABC-three component system middle component 2 [Streptomyces sp. XY431]